MSLDAEKTVMEEVGFSLERKVDSLTQINEGLMIHNENLERNIANRDKLVARVQVDVEATQYDLDWMLCVGVIQIVDKLIEHAEFTGVVSIIRHAAFVAREEFGHCNLRSEMISGSYNSSVGARTLC